MEVIKKFDESNALLESISYEAACISRLWSSAVLYTLLYNMKAISFLSVTTCYNCNPLEVPIMPKERITVTS